MTTKRRAALQGIICDLATAIQMAALDCPLSAETHARAAMVALARLAEEDRERSGKEVSDVESK